MGGGERDTVFLSKALGRNKQISARLESTSM